MTNETDELYRITSVLISPDLDYAAILNATVSLKKLFSDATGFDEKAVLNNQPIETGSGLAIAPLAAAMCITDMMRTRVFLLGLKEAIEDRLKLQDGPVKILYAGSGPFATLLTPLTTLFHPGQLQIVLLEINPVSIAHLQNTINYFGLQAYVSAVINADATDFIIPAEQQPDILLSETMKPALKQEPQVAIVSNLISQCTRKPILIPQSIRVEAALLKFSEFNFEFFVLKELLDLNAATAAVIREDKSSLAVFSDGIEIEVPQLPDISFSQLALLTGIRVYKNHVLKFNECGLTIPQQVVYNGIWPQTYRFQYVTGKTPGFLVTKL